MWRNTQIFHIVQQITRETTYRHCIFYKRNPNFHTVTIQTKIWDQTSAPYFHFNIILQAKKETCSSKGCNVTEVIIAPNSLNEKYDNQYFFQLAPPAFIFIASHKNWCQS